MKSQELNANFIKTICWLNETIVDWASGGTQYFLNGNFKQIAKYHFAYPFDSAISSENGRYVFLYKKLGTKGLLLKDGEELREINRPYYCANYYEFPAAFATIEERTYLIHCPVAYNQLDFEDVETGELITNIPNRKPEDHFYSRLEVSPNNKHLMNKGWVWHPLNEISIFNIKECIKNPLLLDRSETYPDVDVEIGTASFIDDGKIVIGSSDEIINEEGIERFLPKHIAIWDLNTGEISNPVAVKENFGNLFGISEHHAWDLYGFPKIIDIKTGEIVEHDQTTDSGKQNSSIMGESKNFPPIVFNRQTKQIAIKGQEKIIVLTPGQIAL